MSERAGLEQVYATTMQPVVEELESARLDALGRVQKAWLITGLAAGVFVLIAVWRSFFPIAFLGLLAVGIGGFLASRAAAEYASLFKQRVLGPLVAAFDPSLRFDAAAGIGADEFQACGLFRHRIDRYRCEDLVEGAIGQTALRFSEVHAEYKTETRDSKGRRKTQWHTIFKGLFFLADFNKNFAGTTYVLPDTAERLFGGLGQTLQSWGSSHGELVKLEDPEFEKAFVVYGSDQVEARYILSTALMRRILDFHRRTGHTIHLAFVQSTVVVAISVARNLFEPALSRSLRDPESLRPFWDDLTLAASLVDDLNLNTRIWSKT